MMLPEAPPGFSWTRRGGGWTLVCEALAPWHGFTIRSDPGGAARSDAERVDSAGSGVPPARVRLLRQVHSADVLEASSDRDVAGQCGDALVSRDREVVVAVRVADCVPMLLGDRGSGAVAAVHAGWRGTCAGIGPNAVQAMTAAFGTKPGDLVAALGPSIGPCCYETGPDVRAALAAAGWPSAAVGDWFDGTAGRYLDLWRANRDQLIAAGVDGAAVFVSGLCTACHDVFDSYRRDGEQAGRMLAYVRAAAGPW